MELQEQDRPFFSDRMLACPQRGHWTSFRLVDEHGDGKPYGWLPYTVVDSVGQEYTGWLDDEGQARVENHYRGPVVVRMDKPYSGPNELYGWLMNRPAYPLPITELQVRAEQTRFFHEDGFRREHNPAIKDADVFIQVEVRDLVRHGVHLPPVVKRFYEPQSALLRAVNELSFGPEISFGIGLMPNKHSVLEVRPMRALRPMLSTDDKFCALNLYQLALMATLSYTDFGQDPAKKPVDKVRFALDPSIGNLLGEALAGYRENWRIDKSQSQRFYPLYEDVPYSKRLEILPFDPTLYELNHPDKGQDQEHPANQHFFDDQEDGGDTQAFICHHDEIILVAVRGTASLKDAVRDVHALQVPFEEGEGKVHQGFYSAFQAISDFVKSYLGRFHSGQKIIICGHSLGGAIALLLAEALRREKKKYNILLYTYGAPRVGDSDFVKGASELVHHRMVNNNDPVPGVPAPWMDANWKVWVPGVAMTFVSGYGLLVFGAGLVRVGGSPYQHHGQQQHFMPVHFDAREPSSILWDPDCESIEDAACTAILKNTRSGDMPVRDGVLAQLINYKDHMMLASYIPYTWATLRRWQQTQETGTSVVTEREYQVVEHALVELKGKLTAYYHRMRYEEGPRGPTRDEDATMDALLSERSRLEKTRQRLASLLYRRLTLRDVYGSAAQSPELALSLKRWAKHTENLRSVRYAMIPLSPNDGLRITARPLDIDSII